MGILEQVRSESKVDRRQKIARAGGRARAKILTPERRQEIANKAAASRWGRTAEPTAEPDELKRRIAALVLIIKRGYSAADIERHFGWNRCDVERWIDAGKSLW